VKPGLRYRRQGYAPAGTGGTMGTPLHSAVPNDTPAALFFYFV
jgi:hypothetical protein